MTTFETEQAEELPDRMYVRVDGIYDVALIRTPEGIVIDVYPKDWDSPLDTFTVWDDDIGVIATSDDV